MACRRILRQIVQITAQRRKRCTAAAATTAGCPFHRPVKAAPEAPLTKSDVDSLKPFEAIPAPKGLPLVGTLFDLIRKGGSQKIHEYCDMRHRELGPIFREKLGTVDAVVLSDKDYIQRVYYSEGRYPVHMVPEAWLIYNELKGIKRGLFFMDGEQWRDRRKLLNEALLSMGEVTKYEQAFNDVVTDLTDRWQTVSRREKDGVVPNLENELYNWSIETLGTMVFGRRLGCVLPPQYKNQMHEFVYYVQQIFTESAKLSVIPPKLASTLKLPVWRRFVNAADHALQMAREYTEERISEIKNLQAAGEEVPGVLSQLLQCEDVSRDETVNIVADLILAAADTTSHATQWALYSLAKHPECQEKFFSQIKAVVPPGQIITMNHLEKIPYAMWIIKETLRLYPIASFLTRVLPEKIVLGDYEIPAGKLFVMSQYTIGRNPEEFENPDSFKPERWDRSSKDRRPMSNGCMPFGIGARSCIGRRVAELKMRLLLARAVQRFHLESANERDVGISMRLITAPDEPIRLRFKQRSS
ncbi:Cytochrome P450 315a1, mitochondrial, partial [Stegodyphus mimosarum]